MDAVAQEIPKSTAPEAAVDIVQRAYESVLFELAGAPGKIQACQRNAQCKETQVQPTRPALVNDLKELANRAGGTETQEFKDNLSKINKLLKGDAVTFSIEGTRNNNVLVGRHGDTFEVANEDGLVTVKPMAFMQKFFRSRRSVDPIFRGDASFTPADIAPDNVNQRGISDCYFLGAAAAVALVNRASVASMIRRNEDRTYTVTFPGLKDQPITIKPPNRAEHAFFNQSKSPSWIDILEKAHRKYQDKSLFDDRGSQGKALRLLTGEDSSDISFADIQKNTTNQEQTNEYMAQLIKSAIDNNAPLVAASKQDDEKSRSHGIVQAHTYTILTFDSARSVLTLRNPQGAADDNSEKYTFKGPGVFEIPMASFAQDFDYVSTLTRAVPKQISEIAKEKKKEETPVAAQPKAAEVSKSSN